MLDTHQLQQALLRQLPTLRESVSDGHEAAVAGRRALNQLSQLTHAELTDQLSIYPNPGARPTYEFGATPTIIPADFNWQNHEEAREWARHILTTIRTCAVDGSQIYSDRSVSLPISVVQVGRYINGHDPRGQYEKTVRLELLSGADLMNSPFTPDDTVNLRRFEMEIEELISYIRSLHRHAAPFPVLFFDGSFIVSFTQQLVSTHQRRYTDAVQRLLDVSEEIEIPVVGYVDTSYATDLVTMLKLVTSLPDETTLSDGALFSEQMNWGDRSQMFVCARQDAVLDRYYERVCFAYLKTAAGLPPARVEIPRWAVERYYGEVIMDVVTAECVVGTGYPYAAETADALAVLDGEDRDRFLAIVQTFAEQHNLPLRISRKATSKRLRR